MKTQHKALRFYIQAKVHTHTNKSREVGTKDVIATSTRPVVLPTAALLVIHQGASEIQMPHSYGKGCGRLRQRCPDPCNAFLSPFLPSSPRKSQLGLCQASPSLLLTAAFSERQENNLDTASEYIHVPQ